MTDLSVIVAANGTVFLVASLLVDRALQAFDLTTKIGSRLR